MIKKHKRKNTGYLRRSSRIYLPDLNKGKEKAILKFLNDYANTVRYFIEMFWSKEDFSSVLPQKEITDRAVERFGITARLSQLAAKQAKEIVRSQHKKSKSKRTMPKFRNIVVNLDQRFFTLEKFDGCFDWALRFSSGLPKITILFGHTKHSLKLLGSGWLLSNSVRLGIKKKRLWADLIFEKPKPEPKKEGSILGLDLGYRCLLATSRRERVGAELKAKIEKSGKRRKSFHHYIQCEANRLIKQINLESVKTIILENLKNVKKGTRGMFPRRINRLLSFWHYARVSERLRQICEEEGVRIEFKDPYKTSQRCPACGKIERRNRNGSRFKCIYCGFKEDADIVGAMNLEALGLAGVYSLRLLKNQSNGIFVH